MRRPGQQPETPSAFRSAPETRHDPIVPVGRELSGIPINEVGKGLEEMRIGACTPKMLEHRTQVVQRPGMILVLQPPCGSLQASIDEIGRGWGVAGHHPFLLSAAHPALRPDGISWQIGLVSGTRGGAARARQPLQWPSMGVAIKPLRGRFRAHFGSQHYTCPR